MALTINQKWTIYANCAHGVIIFMGYSKFQFRLSIFNFAIVLGLNIDSIKH